MYTMYLTFIGQGKQTFFLVMSYITAFKYRPQSFKLALESYVPFLLFRPALMVTSGSMMRPATGTLILIADMISLRHIGMILTLGVVIMDF